MLRHPTPDIDIGVCYGRLDVEMAEVGHSQIDAALRTVPPIRKILASPARRCRELCTRLSQRDGVDIVFDDRLWEMDMGEFEGMRWDEITPQKSAFWFADPLHHCTPGGESFADVQVRVLQALQHASDDTAVVCHAGVIRAVQMAWEQKTFHEVFEATPGYAEPIYMVCPTAAEK